MAEQQQFGRKIGLFVYGDNVVDQLLQDAGLIDPGRSAAVDLSELRIKFSVKRSDTMTPNIADIRVYNVAPETAASLAARFRNLRVLLQAGYESNYGVIFQGNIKQLIIGRESATDTFIDIIAGDGDRSYNFAVVNTTLAAGVTPFAQVVASVASMTETGGVKSGHIGDMPTTQLPRGKVMYGNAKNYLRNIAQSTDKSWSIQDEKVTFVSNKSYLKGTAVDINADNGMIGTPQQTNEGVNVKALLNPLIKIGQLIKLDNKSIANLAINLSAPATAAAIPAPLNADGTYYVLVIEHNGDTRGVDWYSSMICLNTDVSANPANAVQVGYG